MLSQTKTQYSTVSASPHRPVVRVPEAEKVASAVVDEPPAQEGSSGQTSDKNGVIP